MYPILELVQKEIFKMHKWAGNAVTDGYTIVLGNGATQLVRCATSPYAPELSATARLSRTH